MTDESGIESVGNSHTPPRRTWWKPSEGIALLVVREFVESTRTFRGIAQPCLRVDEVQQEGIHLTVARDLWVAHQGIVADLASVPPGKWLLGWVAKQSPAPQAPWSISPVPIAECTAMWALAAELQMYEDEHPECLGKPIHIRPDDTEESTA